MVCPRPLLLDIWPLHNSMGLQLVEMGAREGCCVSWHSCVLQRLREETMHNMYFASMWLYGLDHLLGYHAWELDSHSLVLTLGLRMGNWVFENPSVPIWVTSWIHPRCTRARFPLSTRCDIFALNRTSLSEHGHSTIEGGSKKDALWAKPKLSLDLTCPRLPLANTSGWNRLHQTLSWGQGL